MDASVSISGSTSFYLFPNLPSEIQIKIFIEIARHPRIVSVHSRRIYPEDWAASGIQYDEVAWKNNFICRDPIPVAFHICHASRQEAIGIYTKAFRPYLNPDSTLSSELTIDANYVWVNWELDTFQISSQFTLCEIIQVEQAQIRKLILRVAYNNVSFETEFKALLAPLQKLQHLDILTDVGLSGWDGRLDVIWAIFEDSFGGMDGWKHPDVRIVAEETGDVMTYSTEARWHAKFAAGWYEAHYSTLDYLDEGVGLSRHERFISFVKTYRSGHNRKRPIDPKEESVELDYADYGWLY